MGEDPVLPPTKFPTAFAELGFVRPLVLSSPTAIALPGPDAVGSGAYAVDYAVVKALGARDGSSRTADQTATALFWTPTSWSSTTSPWRPVTAIRAGDDRAMTDANMLGHAVADVAAPRFEPVG